MIYSRNHLRCVISHEIRIIHGNRIIPHHIRVPSTLPEYFTSILNVIRLCCIPHLKQVSCIKSCSLLKTALRNHSLEFGKHLCALLRYTDDTGMLLVSTSVVLIFKATSSKMSIRTLSFH